MRGASRRRLSHDRRYRNNDTFTEHQNPPSDEFAQLFVSLGKDGSIPGSGDLRQTNLTTSAGSAGHPFQSSSQGPKVPRSRNRRLPTSGRCRARKPNHAKEGQPASAPRRTWSRRFRPRSNGSRPRSPGDNRRTRRSGNPGRRTHGRRRGPRHRPRERPLRRPGHRVDVVITRCWNRCAAQTSRGRTCVLAHCRSNGRGILPALARRVVHPGNTSTVPAGETEPTGPPQGGPESAGVDDCPPRKQDEDLAAYREYVGSRGRRIATRRSRRNGERICRISR